MTRSSTTHPRPGSSIDAASLAQLIADEALTIVFQPIVDLRTATIIGHEALTRLRGDGAFGSTADLFDAATRTGMLKVLERTTSRRTFLTVAERGARGLLFMNNSPEVVADPMFAETVLAAVQSAGTLDCAQVVLELTERTTADVEETLTERSDELRRMGFEIALDDVGAGLSGLTRILQLRPHWVKIDRQLIKNIHNNPIQQNLLRCFVHFARLSNMALVAEGIELAEELAVLVGMGVPFGQGYHLARPGAIDRQLDAEVREELLALNHRRDRQRHEEPSLVRVAGLARAVSTVQWQQRLADAASALADPSAPPFAVVLEGRRYLGVVGREDLLSHARLDPEAPLDAIAVRACPVVGPTTTLAEALEMLASHPADPGDCPLVVEAAGRIEGVIVLRDLLSATAQARRRTPAHVAALTGLPGRAQADQWIDGRIRARDPVNLGLVDLRNFDA
jgi:EAL domain-containing protein (putative c-di-GMP-specific phosphodiesterase class I)